MDWNGLIQVDYVLTYVTSYIFSFKSAQWRPCPSRQKTSDQEGNIHILSRFIINFYLICPSRSIHRTLLHCLVILSPTFCRDVMYGCPRNFVAKTISSYIFLYHRLKKWILFRIFVRRQLHTTRRERDET